LIEPVLVVTNLDERLTLKIIEKLFAKHGKVLSVREVSAVLDYGRGIRVEFDKAASALNALEKLNGKKALKTRMKVMYEKESRGLSAEAQMKAIQAKLAKLEQGVDAETELGRLGKTGNKHVFNTRGKGSGVWNGVCTTKTKQSTTIFISNIPRGKIGNIKDIFKDDPGFYATRIIRHMAFIDYESIYDATQGMIKHQNGRMPGVPLEHGGLVIDYDKDSRQKRNSAYEKSKAPV